MSTKKHTLKFLIFGLASACLFGAATPASKALLAGLHPQLLAGLLYLGAALGVLPSIVKGGSMLPSRSWGVRTIWQLTAAIVLGGILGPLLLLLGLRMAAAGSVSLWLNLEFVATVFLGNFLFREHLSGRGWIAAAGTLLASLLLAGMEGNTGILAAGLIGAGCLCWGFDNHLTALIDGITPAQITFWKGIVAGGFNLLCGLVLAGSIGTPGFVLPALGVGALAYGASVVLYIVTAREFGASRSQMIFSTAPFFGLLLSVMVLGEAFTGMQALASGIIILSLVVLFTEKHAHVHHHDAAHHQHHHNHDETHHDHSHDEAADEKAHTHWHEHEPTKHEHKHWPDLHHRHTHGGEDC